MFKDIVTIVLLCICLNSIAPNFAIKLLPIIIVLFIRLDDLTIINENERYFRFYVLLSEFNFLNTIKIYNGSLFRLISIANICKLDFFKRKELKDFLIERNKMFKNSLYV